MSVDLIDKEHMYFSNEELELLRSFIGKELTHTNDVPVGDSPFALFSLYFSDGSVLNIENDYALMEYGYDEENLYLEGGNFHLSNRNIEHKPTVYYVDKLNFPIPEEMIPFSRVVRRVYVVNETAVFNDEATGKACNSFIHTSAIILMFCDEDDVYVDNPRFLYVRQTGWNSALLDVNVVDEIQQCIKSNFADWDDVVIASASVIRVG